MDVVRRNIAALGGSVEVSSTAGVGTSVSIRLPLTLAIVDGLSVGVGETSYIIPLTSIVESLQPQAESLRSVAPGCDVLYFRGEPLEIVPLHSILESKERKVAYEEGILVVVDANGRRIALFVDRLENQHQVVVKSLEANFRRVRHFSGACVMGDGRVAFILDVASFTEGVRSVNREAALV